MATTQTNVNKEVNQGILRDYLGIVDGSDIDFGTYKTLIREKIAAARMGDSNVDSGDAEVLTKEFKRIKRIEIPESQEQSKIDAKKFFAEQEKAAKNVAEKSNEAAKKISKEKFTFTAEQIKTDEQKVNPKLLLPGTAEPQQDEEEEKENDVEEIKKGLEEVSLKLTDLEENLQSILKTLKDQFKLDKKEEREEDNLEAKEKRKSREASLEGKDKEKTDKSINKKVVKPVKGIFDNLMDFFKNILLGGALLLLLKLLKDPKKFLQPLIDAFNSVLEFFNGIIRAINGFINEFNFFILKPISDFIIGPIYSSFNFIEDRINDVLKLFGQDPLNNIPDTPPQIQIPKIPEIPKFEPFETESKDNPQTPPVDTQGMKGGGIVQTPSVDIQLMQSGGIVQTPPVKIQGMKGGGKVNSNTGQKITGMGVDTQMVALQPGEFVMSKPAVNTYGANNLLAMNKAGGGTNIPSGGAIPGFSGGGYLEDVKQRDNTEGANANKKIFLHWSATSRNSVGPYANNAGYHTQITSGGLKSVKPYGSTSVHHTYKQNSKNAASIAVSGMGGAAREENYNSWGSEAITPGQYTGMAKEAAALATVWGWKPSDITAARVRTHSEEYRDHPEWYRRNVSSDYRWDLNRLFPARKKNTGGDEIRNMIKQQMGMFAGNTNKDGGGRTGGPDRSGTQGRPAPSSRQKRDQEEITALKSRIDADIAVLATGGLVAEGTVMGDIMRQNLAQNKQKLSQLQTAFSKNYPDLKVQSLPMKTDSTGGTTSSSMPSASPVARSQSTRTAPGPREVDNSIFIGPNDGGPNVPQNATPRSTAAGGSNQSIPSFSSQDDLNTETFIIKSIYNLVV